MVVGFVFLNVTDVNRIAWENMVVEMPENYIQYSMHTYMVQWHAIFNFVKGLCHEIFIYFYK